MTTPLLCTHCNAQLNPAHVDHQRQIATCSSCGRLVDVRAQLMAPHAPAPAAAAVPAPGLRTRPPVELPPGMTFESDVIPTGSTSTGTRITIRRRWLRGKHWVFLLICMAMSAVVVSSWLGFGPIPSEGSTGWLIFATLFVLSWDYNVTTMFINSTTIRAEPSGVDVKHGPIPSPFGLSRRLEKGQLKQLYAVRHGSLYAVKAQRVDGMDVILVAPLVSEEQALFVEQQLEKVLGLVDFAVEGELHSVALGGAPVPGAKPGVALALLIPISVVGAMVLFTLAASTEVAGKLEADGKVGAWVFTPDDCISGQREGFGGVVLSSSNDSSRVIRVVKDPVKGALLVVSEASGKTHVFEPDSCDELDLVAKRTNTSINDIWAVDGRASVKCPGLAGTLTFEGCH